MNTGRITVRTVAVILACAVAFASRQASAQEQAPAPATAADAAKDYARLMQSAKPAQAIRAYWDMDAMLRGIFGEQFNKHTDAERADMQRLLLEFVEKVYANPDIAQAMKQSKFEDFKTTENAGRGLTVVTFNVRIQDKVIPNSLQMKQVDGRWRIQDAGANGKMMVPSIRADYEPKAQRVTPLEYVKSMVAQGPGEKKSADKTK